MQEVRYYFIQYWACTNPEILTFDNLRETLYKIWEECWNSFSNCEYEGFLFDLGKKYKQRILKGVSKNERTKSMG